MADRLTQAEEDAILTALAQCLAGPLDGFVEGSADEERAVRAMVSAQRKLWARQKRRSERRAVREAGND